MIKTTTYSMLNETNKKNVAMIDNLLNSTNPYVMASSPAILLIGEEGSGYMSFNKLIQSMVEESAWLASIHGTAGKLELAFPKNSAELENQFFDSPSRAAIFRNHFYGTMFISFQEYSGDDLVSSASFDRLLNFVIKNKSRIKFVFHISPKFEAKEALKARLSSVVNTMEIELLKPDKKQAYNYTIEGFEQRGYVLSENSCKTLEKRLAAFVKDDGYEGYPSLVNIMDKVDYFFGVTTRDDNEITKEDVCEIFKTISAEKKLVTSTSNSVGIGFIK